MTMRKRSLIILAATIPAWIVYAHFGAEFDKDNRAWGYEGSPPPYLIGAGLAIVLTPFAALVLFLIDHISWRRRQNDRTNQTD